MSEPCMGRLSTHRSTALWRFRCYADPRYFLPWDEVPDVLKDELEANGELPCEGGGMPGWWCEECRFGKGEELTVIEHKGGAYA
jgi:hypothetical protein